MKSTTALRAALSLVIVTGAGASFGQENYSQWAQHRNLYINTSGSGANTTTDVVKFPLLVRLDSTNFGTGFAQSRGKGQDIRFTKAGDAIRLPHQIERWDSAGKKAEIWVLLDSVKANSRTQFFRMHWGKADAADSSRGTSVFDSANGFVGVWHLGDSTGHAPRPNAAQVAPAAILRNFDTQQSFETMTPYGPKEGVIAFADSLRGGSDIGGERAGDRDYIDLNHRGSTAFNDFSTGIFFSTWINVTASQQYERFLEWSDDTAATGSSEARLIFFGNHTTAPQNFSMRWGPGGLAYNDETGNRYTEGQWHYVAFSKPAGNAPISLYADGMLIGTTDPVDDQPDVLRDYVAMGRSTVTAGDAYYQGKFDEAVLARTARSADWVRLSYHSQKPRASIISDTAQAATAPGAPATVTATRVADQLAVQVTWTAPVSNGGEAITGYTVRLVSDPTKTCSTTTTLTCTISGLAEATPYQFAVRATNAIGTGDSTLSNVVTIPVGVLAGERLARLQTRLGHKELLFNLPADLAASVSRISVSLVETSGRVHWKGSTAAVPGLNRVSWNAQGTAPGVYIARISLVGAHGRILESFDHKLMIAD